MTYKEIMKKYEDGNASESEKEMIESEIEKFKTISDHVYSEPEYMTDPDGEVGNSDLDESKKFTKSVNKKIKRSLRSTVVGVMAAGIVLIMVVTMTFPHLINVFYYNPAQRVIMFEDKAENGMTYALDAQQIELDFAVFSQLRMPLEHRYNASAVSQGYGKYQIIISQSDYIKNEPVTQAAGGQLVRNKLTLYPPDFLSKEEIWYRFTYLDNDIISNKTVDETNKSFFNDIKDLKNDDPIKVIISFEEPVTYKEMLDIEKKYSLKLPWYAIDCGKTYFAAIGFSATNKFAYDDYEKIEYPLIYMDIGDKEKENEELMKERFMSMLDYMNEQKKFLSIFDMNYELDNTIYKTAYEHMQYNDLSVYGTVTYINKTEAEKIVNDGVAQKIELKDYKEEDISLY